MWSVTESGINPLGPRPPALISYHTAADCPVADGKHTLHTNITSGANRNRILARLVTSLLRYAVLLASSVEFERCCEFSKLRDGCMKINKSPSVRNGIRT